MKLGRIKYGLIVMLGIVSLNVHAQQDPLFTQYMNDPELVNPAWAGSIGIPSINGLFRKQWVGMDWSPSTTSITGSSPFKDYSLGLGFTFIDDQIGPSHQTGLYFDYAKYLYLKKGRNLSLGLKAGFNYFDINLLNLIMYENDPYLAENSPTKVFLPNVGLGLFYFTQKFFIGISAPKLIRNSFHDSQNTLLSREERHYFFNTGYLFYFDNPMIKVRVNALLRVVNGAPGSFEVGSTAIILDKFWLGGTYRIGDAVAINARFQINDNFQVGYSYDLNNSRLSRYNYGSHEIYLNFRFRFEREKIASPRYFF